MRKYSLSLLLIAIAVVCVVLAMLFTPRGRISETAFAELRQGMSVDDAIAIIGLPPGWHDGVTSVGGLPTSNSKLGNVQVCWLNQSGAIVANVKDGLQDIEHYDKDQLSIYHDSNRVLYDRTIDRVYGSQSVFATILILAIMFVLPMLPLFAFAKLCNVDLRELAAAAMIVALPIYVGVGIINGKWWWHHQSTDFFGIAALIAGMATAATILMLVVRLAKRVFPNRSQPPTTTVG
jgi:hypothetical protein